jgi:TPR repeat protein
MPILHFDEILNDALEGKEKALIIWFHCTIENQFDKEEIEKAFKAIQTVLSNPSSPKRANALYLKGLWFHMLSSIERKPDVAIKCYEEAIKLNHPFAMNARAMMHGKGEEGEVNLPKAIELLEKAIVLNHSEAMNSRALMHQLGIGGEINYPMAIELYERAITLENPHAMTNRAIMYKKGQGDEKDYPKAIELFEKAINTPFGDPTALLERAIMHMEGQGGEKNYQEAFRLFKEYEKEMKFNSVLEYFSAIKNNGEIRGLYHVVNQMQRYGEEIGGNKGDLVKCHAEFLKLTLDSFLIKFIYKNPTLDEEKAFKLKFKELLHRQDKEMQSHRAAWKPIIANILIALTGIGLIAIIGKVAAHAASSPKFSKNKAFFFAQTRTERLAEEIEKADQWTLNK